MAEPSDQCGEQDRNLVQRIYGFVLATSVTRQKVESQSLAAYPHHPRVQPPLTSHTLPELAASPREIYTTSTKICIAASPSDSEKDIEIR